MIFVSLCIVLSHCWLAFWLFSKKQAAKQASVGTKRCLLIQVESKKKCPKPWFWAFWYNLLLYLSGERGIRTPGGVTLNGFQDHRIRPLCHFSATNVELHFNLTIEKIIFLYPSFCYNSNSMTWTFYFFWKNHLS